MSWCLAGIFLLTYAINFDDFILDRNLLITDSISFFATMFSYIIMALVIYKSSIIAASDATDEGQEPRVTLVSELREIYNQERQLKSTPDENSAAGGELASHRSTSTPGKLNFRKANRGELISFIETEPQLYSEEGDLDTLYSERPVSKN